MKKFYFFEGWTPFFWSLERRFFCSRISYNTFSWAVLRYKKAWKMALFFTKTMGLAVVKMWIFWYFKLFIFKGLRGVFIALEYRMTHFPELYCLKRKGWKKGPIFDQNYWLTPWENLNFSSFCSSFFYSLERRFLVLEYRQTHFLCFFFLKWKDEKKLNFWTKTVQDHGLTLLKKC